MNADLTSKTATELARLIRTRAVSPVNLAEAYLHRINELNPTLNAVVTLAPDVIAKAREAEAAVFLRGDNLGPLHGVPITIKDTIETAGLRTTSGSRLREHYIPTTDATAVMRLKAAGAIILGKTNTSELAIPYETDNPVFGPTQNPFDLKFTPGGSSGGEAAAIAAKLSPAGLGSDLSGSIRVPAHFCGITGLKPTSARIPMDGHFPPASGTFADGACLGPMARRVEDLTLLFNVLAETQSAFPESQLKNLRVAWYSHDGVSPVTKETALAVNAAGDALRTAGLETVESRPPGIDLAANLWVDLYMGKAAAQARQLYAGRIEQAGPLVRKVIDSTIEYAPEIERRAILERYRLRSELLSWMEKTPLILAPTGATPAFVHGSKQVHVESETIGVFRAFSYARAYNVLDFPAVTVPAGRSPDGMPIGVQIIGRPFAEDMVLAAASVVDEAGLTLLATQKGGNPI